jgi:hypothetical protein
MVEVGIWNPSAWLRDTFDLNAGCWLLKADCLRF